MKIKCFGCDAIAVWLYMPTESNTGFCDDCVPRGCSCNFVIDDDCNPIIDDTTGDYVQCRDDLGRLIPCCEYDYFEDGIDEDE